MTTTDTYTISDEFYTRLKKALRRREKEALELFLQGKTVQEVAKKLKVTNTTATIYKSNIKRTIKIIKDSKDSDDDINLLLAFL